MSLTFSNHVITTKRNWATKFICTILLQKNGSLIFVYHKYDIAERISPFTTSMLLLTHFTLRDFELIKHIEAMINREVN